MDFLPKIDLDKNQIVWLKAIWKSLLEHGKVPDYRSIRIETSPKTGASFKPMTIPNELAMDKATRITFLGVLLIDPDSKVWKVAEEITFFIKQGLTEDANREGFTIVEISKGISQEPDFIRIIIELLHEYGSFWSSASSSGASDLFGYEAIQVDREEVFDFYLAFDGLKDVFVKYFAKKETELASRAELDNEYHITSRRVIDGAVRSVGIKLVNKHEYIDQKRILDLEGLNQDKFDFKKLIQLCHELNACFAIGHYYATPLLLRAIIDHVPPVFGYKGFKEFSNQYPSEGNSKSFRKSMIHLDKSLRSIGDSAIHSHIRKSEVLPTATQVDFRNDLDVLFGEIIRILK